MDCFANYEGMHSETRALQHSKAHRTWFEIETGRYKKLKRNEIESGRYKKLKRKVNLHQGSEYAKDATSESETDDGIDTYVYHALLLSGDNSNEDNRMEMEVGLEDPRIYNDPRFSRLFKTADYFLDPTDPSFKRSAAYVRQLARNQHNEQPSEEGNSSRRQE